jgi:hypothetical protein
MELLTIFFRRYLAYCCLKWHICRRVAADLPQTKSRNTSLQLTELGVKR